MGLVRFSRRVIASRAIRYAINHRDDFVAFLNERLDIPVLTEEQEGEGLTLLVEGTLVAVDRLLVGSRFYLDAAGLSKRGVVEAAVEFAADNIDDVLGEGIDIPGVPESAELWLAEQLQEFLLGPVAEWAKTSPVLD